MKVLITTQYRENYGSENEPYWKFKGGEVFIVPDLTVAQTLKVKEQGIPTLKALIETRSDMYEEYVVDYALAQELVSRASHINKPKWINSEEQLPELEKHNYYPTYWTKFNFNSYIYNFYDPKLHLIEPNIPIEMSSYRLYGLKQAYEYIKKSYNIISVKLIL